jgi:hypothetical protein
MGAVEWLLGSIGAILDRQDYVPFEWSVAQARSGLGEHEFEHALYKERAMGMEQAIEYALEQQSPDWRLSLPHSEV